MRERFTIFFAEVTQRQVIFRSDVDRKYYSERLEEYRRDIISKTNCADNGGGMTYAPALNFDYVERGYKRFCVL